MPRRCILKSRAGQRWFCPALFFIFRPYAVSLCHVASPIVEGGAVMPVIEIKKTSPNPSATFYRAGIRLDRPSPYREFMVASWAGGPHVRLRQNHPSCASSRGWKHQHRRGLDRRRKGRSICVRATGGIAMVFQKLRRLSASDVSENHRLRRWHEKTPKAEVGRRAIVRRADGISSSFWKRYSGQAFWAGNASVLPVAAPWRWRRT